MLVSPVVLKVNYSFKANIFNLKAKKTYILISEGLHVNTKL